MSLFKQLNLQSKSCNKVILNPHSFNLSYEIKNLNSMMKTNLKSQSNHFVENQINNSMLILDRNSKEEKKKLEQ